MNTQTNYRQMKPTHDGFLTHRDYVPVDVDTPFAPDVAEALDGNAREWQSPNAGMAPSATTSRKP